MNIYTFTYIVFALSSFVEIIKNRNNYDFAFFGYIYIFILGTIRWKTGTDWDSYCNYFYDCHSIYQYISSDESFEYGYKLINAIANTLYRSYSVVISFGTFLCIYSFYLFRKSFKLVKYPATLLMLFWSILPFGGIFCTRQFFALSICIISLRYIKKRDLRKFIFCIIIACFFHSSAIIFTPSYYLYYMSCSIKRYIQITLVFLICGSVISVIINYLIDMYVGNYYVTKLTIYDTENFGMEKSGLLVSTLKRLFTIPLFFYYINKINNSVEKKQFIGFLNLYLFGTFVFYLFALSNLGQLVRFSIYFQFFELPLIYYIMRYSNKMWVFILIYAFCMMKIYSFIAGYPDLYIPFETIFDINYKHTY